MTTQRIGRYEIVAPLAKGGMGELVLAREHGPAGFERLVVVKRIRPQVAEDPDVVEGFLREARLVARLNHPNIVQIIELGEVDGRPDEYFIAMEYIEGSSVGELQVLSELLDGPIPLEVVVSIGVQACRGLEAAHDLRDPDGAPVGLIHRDVSPQNLMCTTRGFVKLLDFGIAKTTEGLETTWSGVRKGKPGYFSPEQVQNWPLDRRSDIFSLGTVLWELASGERLFERGNTLETLRAVVEAPIPLLQEYRVDPRLGDIIGRALSRDREQRYATAAEFRSRLSDYAATQQWDDVHDALSAFVSETAGTILASRRRTVSAARSRELSEVEGKSLVHVTNHEELAATEKTLDIPAAVLEALETARSDSQPEAAGDDRGRSSAGEGSEHVTPVPDDEAALDEPESGAEVRGPGSMRRAAARDALLVLAGFVAITVATVHAWLRPAWLPAAAFLAIVCVPVVGWRMLSAPESTRIRAAMGALSTGFVFLLTAAAWMATPVRAVVAETVAALELQGPAGKALFDPDPAVASAVCRGLERSELRLPQDVVAQKLSSTQPDSAACLVEQLDPQATRTKVVLDYLIPRWSEELRHAAASEEEDQVCDKTKWMARAIKLSGRDADLSLLDCALRAEAVPARQCCTQAFRLLAMGQTSVAMSLPPAETAVDNGGVGVAEFLTAIWRGEAEVDTELRQTLELDAPGTRAWVLSVHCEALARSSTTAAADSSLANLKSLVATKCELPANIDQEHAVWASACQWFFEERRFWEATGAEDALLCREVAGGVGAVTFRAARNDVKKAVEAAIAEDEPGRTKAQRAERERRCRKGDGDVCQRLGLAYQRARKYERAFEFYEAGCDAGDPTSCNAAGYVLSIELPDDTPDKGRALQFYERACTMGESTGCANQADELRIGRFTKRDLKRASQIYRAQCGQGHGYACGGLAGMYWEGLGVQRDPDEAIALWTKACANGYSRACVDLALDARSVDPRPSDIPSETILLRKGCMVLSKSLCLRDMGHRYLVGRGTTIDEKRARRYFEWACELGDEKSCSR
jgi:serine/threonine-protein kinase